MRKQLKSLLLGILSLVAVISVLISYYIASFFSRIVLLVVFFMLLWLIFSWVSSNEMDQTGLSEKAAMFAIMFAVSLSFLFRRYHYMSPNYVEVAALPFTRALAQAYSEAGVLVFKAPNSFVFQHPLVLGFLTSICGIPIRWVVYVSLLLHAVLVALVSIIFLSFVKSICKNYKRPVSTLIPPIVAFSLVSFAYSERSELALPIMFLLMSYLFNGGFTSRTKSATILLLIVGITLGSTTSILVMIPFFLLFSFFRRSTIAIVYSLIPLSYLIFAGQSYTVGLKEYSTFAWEGFLEFLKETIVGKLPERVVPWERSTVPTAGDVRLTSVGYVSLILFAVVVVLIAVFIWVRKRRSFERNDENALFLASSVTVFILLGIVSLVYIGASVKPEVPFSDIRTIAIVVMTVLMPFLFASHKMLAKIDSSKVLLALLVVLLILASLRTFYESYPKSIYDPINVVEDVRVDSLATYSAGNFLKTFKTEGIIAFDFKTGVRIYPFLSPEIFEYSIFTSTLTPSTVVVFDMNGLELGSIHTSSQAYGEAYNFTLTENVVYNNGNVTVVQRK